MLVLDPSPREAERFTRITRRSRAVRSLPLAPSSVPLIPSCQCAAFIEKSELTTGGSLPRLPFPSSPSRMIPFVSWKILLPQLALRRPNSSIASAGTCASNATGT
jgi:hypothetical protein